MLSSKLVSKFKYIILQSQKMVAENIDKNDLLLSVNYATIFAKSNKEFNEVLSELKKNGTVALKHTTGDYYKLDEPIMIRGKSISICRIRKYISNIEDLGYVDFEVKNYQDFKEKYLPRTNFKLLARSEEMIELNDPKFAVRAYFPSIDF